MLIHSKVMNICINVFFYMFYSFGHSTWVCYPYQVNLVCVMTSKFSTFFLHMSSQLFCHSLEKDSFFLYWIFKNCLKSIEHICVGSISGICIVPLNDMLISTLSYVNYYSFIISIEIKYYKSSNFIHIFQSCFGYSRPFTFAYTF